MAFRPNSRLITDVYRRSIGAVRDEATRQAAGLWSIVDPTNIDDTLPPVLAAVGFIVAAAQTQTAAMAGVYMAAFMSSELDEITDAGLVDPSLYAGVTQDGRPVADVLALSSVSMKQAASGGTATLATISAAGLARTVRTVRTEVVSGARTAQRDLMASDDRVIGYYRAASGNPCMACMSLAGERSGSDEAFPLHGACRCTAEPVMDGVPDRLAPDNGRAILDAQGPDQAAALYGDKAAAITDGKVALGEMATIQEAPNWGPMLFETPLSTING